MTNYFEPLKNKKNHQLSNGSWLLYTNHKGSYEVHILGGISDIEKSFSISETMVDEFIQDKRDEGELLYAAKYGTWPLPKAEQEEAERVFIRETPTALISDPTAIALFKKEELENLIPIAEKEWIDWKGKLPENYTRPILD